MSATTPSPVRSALDVDHATRAMVGQAVSTFIDQAHRTYPTERDLIGAILEAAGAYFRHEIENPELGDLQAKWIAGAALAVLERRVIEARNG